MKKIIIFLAFTLFSIFNFAKVDFKGYEIEGSLGVNFIDSGYDITIPVLDTNAAFFPKWSAEIPAYLPIKIGVEFGPKVTLSQDAIFTKPVINRTSISGGFNLEFNFADEKPIKGYIGTEFGAGVSVNYVVEKGYSASLIKYNLISKLSAGAKINNHKIGGYISHGKGIFGVEYGYTVGK